jgi:hypothetical protein
VQALEIYHTIKETEAEGTTYEALSKAYSQSRTVYWALKDAVRHQFSDRS